MEAQKEGQTMKAFKSLAGSPATPTPATAAHSKQRKEAGRFVYEETLNLVRNTLKLDENAALMKAGYSSHVANHWRKAERFPLVAVNALKGLLLGHEIAAKDGDKKPLLMTTDDLLTLAGEAKSAKLKAALYREVARRVDPDKG